MSDAMNKCYKCKYRGTVSGSRHSSCHHPDIEDEMEAAILFLFKEYSTLNIKANKHGIRSGWFLFPISFDPVWLENCDGFEERKEQ